MGDSMVIILVLVAAAMCFSVVAAGVGIWYFTKDGGSLFGGGDDSGDGISDPGDVITLFQDEGFKGKSQGFKVGEYKNTTVSFEGRPGADFGTSSIKLKNGYKAKIWHATNFKPIDRWLEVKTDMYSLANVTNSNGKETEYDNDVWSMKVMAK